MNTTVPVVSEKYDEVVFTNPKLEFHNLLLSANKGKIEYPLSNESANLEYFRTYGDEEDVQRMLAAKKFLEGELQTVKDRLLKADNELEDIKTSLALVKNVVGESVKPAAASTIDTKPTLKPTEGNKKKVSDNKPKAKKKAAASGDQGPAKKQKTEAIAADPKKKEEAKKESTKVQEAVL